MKQVHMVIGLLLALASVSPAANFLLRGSQEQDITTSYDEGYLYDYSVANIKSGGSVQYDLQCHQSSTANIFDGSINSLVMYHNSTANLFGGSVTSSVCNGLQSRDSSTVNVFGGVVNSDFFYALDFSRVNVSGGTLSSLGAYHNSTVNISGGIVSNWLFTSSDSIVDITGGSIKGLLAYNTSKITLHGYGFLLGSGLSWADDGKTILGTGFLSGKWLGKTDTWTINIDKHDATASIIAIPESCTLLLLGLGGMLIRRG
jgi:hypothetical protein